ncbi:MAG: hypothetical protein HY847_01505 [Betaproteobacteria bacterium]|nr:hypothetical protein [Betaproteobacteria bacterium]
MSADQEADKPESRGDLALAASLRLMAPLVTLLLREGVTYTHFAQALKQVFLDAAVPIIEEQHGRPSDSSISVLSGVHRKDVREWRKVGKPLAPAKTLSVAMQVFARWANDPAYCDDKGQPQLLVRGGGPGSFDELASSVSNDVHPRTLLDELLRLGVVTIVDESKELASQRLRLSADGFVPKEGIAEMLQLFSDNVGDHMATAVQNIKGSGDPMLEQSVYANKLSPQSAEALSALSRQIWAKAFHDVVTEATRLCREDEQNPDANQRIRFGMYYYKGPVT